MPRVCWVTLSRTKLIMMRGENCVDASVNVINRMANTIDTTVIMAVAILLSTSWATAGSCVVGKSMVGIQCRMFGYHSSKVDKYIPAAPINKAITNGRIRNPTRKSFTMRFIKNLSLKGPRLIFKNRYAQM